MKMDKYVDSSSKLEGNAKTMWLESIPLMRKTHRLHSLDAQGCYAFIFGLISFLVFGCLELLNLILPGDLFLIQGLNPLVIHMGFFGGLLFCIAGLLTVRYVNAECRKFQIGDWR